MTWALVVVLLGIMDSQAERGKEGRFGRPSPRSKLFSREELLGGNM